ncbi:kinesin-like protein KIF19 isoform X2 [Palaemon carinicauda]|uniref:kinesin-like protein KIF19 isoform X2 n=1 Tax=Palaemon carinicauda TaxID=392227 RepID=UPI0035B648D4
MAGPKKNDEKKDNPGKSSSERLMVAVRIRPLKNDEKLKGSHRITQPIDNQMMTLQEPDAGKNDHLRQKRNQDKQFMFDRLFSEDSSQKEVYEETTKVLIEDVLNGFNATVFAYGATGAGKTYTMVGSPEQPGIMVRALNDLFHTMESNEDRQVKTKISMSYLEIYNENIKDLLEPGGHLELREDAKTGVIQVAGLSETSTTSTKEVMQLLTKGNKERTCEPTAANKTSSRSHALLQVYVKQTITKGDGEEVKNGRLFMVDLAGSERAKQTQNKGKRLQEGAHINRSLLALGNCINALAEGRAKYVNYRDSKLTRLLKDALSGNCRTVMIAHVSPCHNHREETRNTLVYADRAKNISKNVRKNVLDVSYHVSQYQTIIAELKEEIDRLKGKIEKGECEEDNEMNEDERQVNNEKLRKLKSDLLDHFREQMSLRNKLMDIDSNILALSMEFERQNLVVTEWETEKARRNNRKKEPEKGPDGEQIIDMDAEKDKDEESEDEEPEEVSQAWEDLVYLQKEQQRYTDMREKVEQEMQEVRERAQDMEELLTNRKRCRKRLKRCRRLLRRWKEALPETITTDEQKELLALLCKVHELEIQKVEMQSEALLKEHELRRRDLLLLRYDRQRNLSDEIITRQRQMIEELNPTMPPELQELYTLYQMELQYSNNDRDVKYMNDINQMLRSPSMLSLRAPSYEKLPPINSAKEPEKLFDKPKRRHSFGEERRPESVLSLRSPLSSASSSAPGTAPGSRVPSLPPISGALPSNSPNPDPAELRHGLENINALIARRRGSRRLAPINRHSSLDALDDIKDSPDSPGLPNTIRRRYTSFACTMKIMMLPFMVIAMLMGVTMAKHHEGMKEGDPRDLIMGTVMGMVEYVKETKTCINTNSLEAEMYGMICGTEGCAEHSKHCVDAMMPFEHVCNHGKKCILGEDGNQTFDPRGNLMAILGKCVTKSLIHSMDMEYMEHDHKQNMLSVFEMFMAHANHLPDVTKSHIISAIASDECACPGEDFDVMDVMRFKICLMNKCVKSFAAQ